MAKNPNPISNPNPNPCALSSHKPHLIHLCLHCCRYGEVSRAMRNRGIELFLLPSTLPPPLHPAKPVENPGNIAENPDLALVPRPSNAPDLRDTLGENPLIFGVYEQLARYGLDGATSRVSAADEGLVLASEGVPGWALPAAMRAAHAGAAAAAGGRARAPPGLRALRRWARTARCLVERGWPVTDALRTGWDQVGKRPVLLMEWKNCL
jgi:hypothetical protein